MDDAAVRKSMLGAYGAWAARQLGDGPGRLSLRSRDHHDVDAWRRIARERVGQLLAEPAGSRGGRADRDPGDGGRARRRGALVAARLGTAHLGLPAEARGRHREAARGARAPRPRRVQVPGLAEDRPVAALPPAPDGGTPPADLLRRGRMAGRARPARVRRSVPRRVHVRQQAHPGDGPSGPRGGAAHEGARAESRARARRRRDRPAAERTARCPPASRPIASNATTGSPPSTSRSWQSRSSRPASRGRA